MPTMQWVAHRVVAERNTSHKNRGWARPQADDGVSYQLNPPTYVIMIYESTSVYIKVRFLDSERNFVKVWYFSLDELYTLVQSATDIYYFLAFYFFSRLNIILQCKHINITWEGTLQTQKWLYGVMQVFVEGGVRASDVRRRVQSIRSRGRAGWTDTLQRVSHSPA